MDKMNSRYGFVMVLLLGAFVFGLSSFIGDIFFDDVRNGMNAVAYSPLSWSGSASGGGASSVGSVPVLPMHNSKHSLFHHTAAVPAYTPVSHTSASGATPYYIYTPSHGAAASAGAFAMSSADGFSLGGATEAHGVYLTSGATMQSYGGVMTGYASSSASGSVASGYSTSAGAVSSVPFAASSAQGTSSVSAYSFALNTRTATSPALMQSADQTLAARTAAPARSGVRRVPGIGSTLDNWIQGLDKSGSYWYGEEGGIWYFYEDELRAVYEQAIANGDLPAGTTWDKFLQWFNGQSSKYQFYSAPLPDGVAVLCMLALVYVAFVAVKQYASTKEDARI